MLDPNRQISVSVQDPVSETSMWSESPIVMYFAALADGVPPWPSKARDSKLRKAIQEESTLSGAVFSMVAKLCALDYKLTGPAKAVHRYNDVLQSADFGAGWISCLSKLVQDIYTTDAGGFLELGRLPGASHTSSPVAIAPLDSLRCRHTGDPTTPVEYQDQKGNIHRMGFYDVRTLTDFPTPDSKYRGWGFCAVSRILRSAQLIRDMGIYKRQKLSGKRVPALLFVKGIRRGQVKAAVDKAMVGEAQKGRSLYTGPVILSSNDPGMPVDAKLIELAGLPDGFNEDTMFKWYIATLALAFGTDYSEFAPLPGGNLGSASQVESMSSKSRGKGPGLLVQLIEFMFNRFVLPKTTEFQFTATDPAAEEARVALAHARARERALRVNSQEITPQQALELAIAEGDAPERFLDQMRDPVNGEEENIVQVVRSIGDINSSYREINKALAAR